MMLETLSTLFDQELGKLDQEIQQYPSVTALWAVYSGINNSGGNLALHICGNLRTFIGAMLGNTGYIRNREAEFTTKGLSIEEVHTLIASTR